MGYVKLKPQKQLNIEVALAFGAEVTRPKALKVAARAKALADAKAKHSSVADRIDISVHGVGIHHAVVMSVTGRDGSQVAGHLEFGYFNKWLENKYGIRSPRAWMPGLFIMSEAKYAAVG
ncbi:hypothetical protein [Bifidobacterium eulemuris]|uniref:Uncharacterized protein n=1 Tax=Bifidobacterium eulemuris TaxID=1765219 RepID=A0A261GBC1_9BIFI|nr:hypothetical protein [Bifidobacterium eulemuris]OZG68276.1 hypothetical protein BEUL_1289 [Bifidobacterium eulemuris]QOL31670.1 hypothetical protein BE0216_03730 [Bifidobacterium eulemuris]